MTNRRIRVVQPTDTVKTLRGAGDEYRCLATGRETDNGYFLVAAIVPPGGGPPLHAQTREEEGSTCWRASSPSTAKKDGSWLDRAGI